MNKMQLRLEIGRFLGIFRELETSIKIHMRTLTGIPMELEHIKMSGKIGRLKKFQKLGKRGK